MKFQSSPNPGGCLWSGNFRNTGFKRTDILLIQPPIRDFYLTRKRTIPYGLISMAATLRNSGFSVAVFDALATNKSRPLPFPENLAYLKPFYPKPDVSPTGIFHQYRHFGYSYEHIGNFIRAAQPAIVAISALFTPYADQAIHTAGIAKQSVPEVITVLGGHHPTALPHEVMKNFSVDFVIRGEGEIALLQLAAAIFKGDDIDRIEGVVFRRSSGGLHISKPAVCTDLDLLPVPAQDLVKKNYYRRSKRISLTLTASRGCPMKCTYCSVGADSYLTYRRRSVEHVLKEIEAALALGPIGFIDFEDENLTLNKRWFLELLEKIRSRWNGDPPELRAMNGLFPPSLDSDIISAMAAAGFKTLNLSLGTTSAQQLKRFQRADIRSDFDRVLELARRQGLRVVGYVIVAAPHQCPNDSLQDLLFLAQRRVLAGVSVYYPAPGSRDYALCSRLGLLPNRFEQMRATALPIEHTTRRKETVTLLRLGRMLNFIKELIDREIDLPTPSADQSTIDIGRDRLDIGCRLLSWFRKDHLIRGVDLKGNVYPHLIDKSLTCRFNHALERLDLQGTL